MTPPRPFFSTWLALLIGADVHVDWHFARGHHAPLSGDSPYHWVTAIPVFALAAWYIARRWPQDLLRAGAVTLLLGLLVGQVVEPLGEVATGATWAWAFGPERLLAFAEFAGVGLVTYGLGLALFRARPAA
jgi:hypothetical protein